jgi:Virulence factor BrkB
VQVHATVPGTAPLIQRRLLPALLCFFLADALNTVWEVEPAKASGIWHFVRTYVVSLAAVLSFGFLLLVSLLLTTALAAGGKYIAPYVPELAMHALGSLVSFGMITLLFAMMFKWLPDTDVAWRDVWPGAAVTAALFEIGELLIGLYIGKQALGSTYGAAASLVVLLIWVYYSSQLVLMGAEFTHVYAKRRALENMVQPSAEQRALASTTTSMWRSGAAPTQPPSWRSLSGGFSVASAIATNALGERGQFSAPLKRRSAIARILGCTSRAWNFCVHMWFYSR